MKTYPNLPVLAVSPNEAARMLGIGRTMLYALMGEGEIRYSKMGSRTLIRVAELERWLKAQEAKVA